ncbi:hypothetical protein [Streptomyces sp. NPDC048106]
MTEKEKAEVRVYFDEAMDIHHIFPQAWCQKNGIPGRRPEVAAALAGSGA